MSELKPAAKALIVKDGKFLILSEQVGESTILDLPGGKVEYNESPYDTVVREVKEEIDLEVKPISVAGVYWFINERKQVQIVATTFLCQPLTETIDFTKNPSQSEKFISYNWVTPEEFAKLEGEYPESLGQLVKNINLNV